MKPIHQERIPLNRRRFGQSLVEFALIIPVLLGIFFAIIDGAFIVQGYLAVNHAAREAARFAVSYQPNQGECYDYDGDGNPNNDDWPWCTTETGESDEVYHRRRVEMIKRVAADAATGLRVEDVHVELSDKCDTDNPEESLWNKSEPGMLGVCVWGFPDFESEEEENHPGLQGLPVQVAVIHNVRLVVFAPLTSQTGVKVSGVTEMVNEGIQVGYGNKPPPAFSPPGGGSGDPGDPGDPDDPDPEDIQPHALSLDPATAENQLPEEPTRTFVATVVNEDGDPLRGIRVAFQTNAGSFSLDETVRILHINTTSSGTAVVQIHSTVPANATVTAWADGDGDSVLDGNEPWDESTIEWTGGTYDITLSFDTAVNALPDEREHGFNAHVTSDGANVAGAPVTFKTSPEDGESYAGSFDYSGSGADNQMTVVRTNAEGKAVTSIYANRPITANIRAWLDYNNNGVWEEDDEPSDTATKIWEIAGPYLVVSNHRPFPEEVVSLWVRDHPQGPTTVLFCTIDGVGSSVVIDDALDIPPETGDYDLDLTIPMTAIGQYQVESHTGSVDATACGTESTRIAYSAPIEIADVPPDLVITRVITPALDTIEPGVPITLGIVVSNTVPVPVTTGPFGIDIYVDPGGEPAQGRTGDVKQWITTLGPMESTIITDFVTVYEAENHELWFQVDTMNYVDEGETGGEDNNVFGPVTIPFLDCIPLPSLSDDFDGGLGMQWNEKNFDGEGDDPDGSYTVNGNGELEITSAGSNLWGGPNSYYYLYQTYDGDYDARLRIIQEPAQDNWSKIGIHIAETIDDSETRFVMNMATHNSDPAGEQAAYRNSLGGEPQRTSNSDNHVIGLPSWLRITKTGNTYDFYRTDVADPVHEDWIHQGSHTALVAMNYLGIASASYKEGEYGTGIVDDFEVCEPTGYQDVPPPTELAHIPGSVQCEEVIYVPGFEGNPETVYEYWNPGRAGTYERGSSAFYRGSYSMRLHASLGMAPCSDANSYLDPYLYQTIRIPTEVYSISTLAVTGHYLVAGSDLPCSFPNSPDGDDKLLFNFKEIDGTTVYTGTVLTGGAISNTWSTETLSPTDSVDLSTYQEEEVVLQWRGSHDGDFDGTFFYLDELSAQICTAWPIPEHVSGMATIGGRATTRSASGKTVAVVGADVWAYQRGGSNAYHTRTIQDGSFHFYNVPPGEYVIYAEGLWGGEGVRYATVDLSVSADEVRDDLTLFLE